MLGRINRIQIVFDHIWVALQSRARFARQELLEVLLKTQADLSLWAGLRLGSGSMFVIGVRFQSGSNGPGLVVLAGRLDRQGDLIGAPHRQGSARADETVSSRVHTHTGDHSPAGDCVERETAPSQGVQWEVHTGHGFCAREIHITRPGVRFSPLVWVRNNTWLVL